MSMSVCSEKKKEERQKNRNNNTHIYTQTQMQDCVNCLGLSLKVIWKPDDSKSIHGEIRSNVIIIYCSDEQEAWNTLMHEITEYKLENVTRPYRLLINSLIETLEKSVYAEKEQFIDFLPRMVITVNEKRSLAHNYLDKSVEKVKKV